MSLNCEKTTKNDQSPVELSVGTMSKGKWYGKSTRRRATLRLSIASDVIAQRVANSPSGWVLTTYTGTTPSSAREQTPRIPGIPRCFVSTLTMRSASPKLLEKSQTWKFLWGLLYGRVPSHFLPEDFHIVGFIIRNWSQWCTWFHAKISAQ